MAGAEQIQGITCMRIPLIVTIAAATGLACPAAASEDSFELRFNQSAEFAVGEDTSVQVEGVQWFRDAANGPDTYFARLWVYQSLGDGVTVGGAVEHRINNGASDETRLIQHVALRQGVVRGRLRVEQRFVEGADRTGWRLRPRIGVAVPLDSERRWSFGAHVEPFITLRSTGLGGQEGLTGLRTQMSVSHDVSDQVTLSLGVQRQQDFRRGRTDTVAYAPMIGLEWSL